MEYIQLSYSIGNMEKISNRVRMCGNSIAELITIVQVAN